MLQQVPRDTDAATDGKRCGKRVRCLVSLTFLCGSVLGSWKTLKSVAMFFSPDSANKDVLILLNRCEALSTRPLVLACAYVAMVLGFGLLMCISFFRMRGNTDDIDVSDVYPIASVILLAWSLVVHPQSIAEDFQSMMSFRLDSPRPLLTWLIPVFLILLLLSNQPICNLINAELLRREGMLKHVGRITCLMLRLSVRSLAETAFYPILLLYAYVRDRIAEGDEELRWDHRF